MARILIGNDDADLLDTCREVLEAAGHTVQTVASGNEVLRLAREWQPDVIIVDWVMPDIDGTTAIGALRKDPQTASLPILMISGSDNARVRAARAGANAFLPKPFDAEGLLDAVRALIEAKAAPVPPPA